MQTVRSAKRHVRVAVVQTDDYQSGRVATLPVVDVPAVREWIHGYQLDVVFEVALEDGHPGQTLIPRLSRTNDLGSGSVGTKAEQESQRYDINAIRHGSCSRC